MANKQAVVMTALLMLFALPSLTTMAEEATTVDAFGDGFVETVIADASDDLDDPRQRQ